MFFFNCITIIFYLTDIEIIFLYIYIYLSRYMIMGKSPNRLETELRVAQVDSLERP